MNKGNVRVKTMLEMALTFPHLKKKSCNYMGKKVLTFSQSNGFGYLSHKFVTQPIGNSNLIGKRKERQMLPLHTII